MKRTVLAVFAGVVLSGCSASNTEMTKTQPAFTANDEYGGPGRRSRILGVGMT